MKLISRMLTKLMEEMLDEKSSLLKVKMPLMRYMKGINKSFTGAESVLRTASISS